MKNVSIKRIIILAVFFTVVIGMFAVAPGSSATEENDERIIIDKALHVLVHYDENDDAIDRRHSVIRGLACKKLTN